MYPQSIDGEKYRLDHLVNFMNILLYLIFDQLKSHDQEFIVQSQIQQFPSTRFLGYLKSMDQKQNTGDTNQYG